MKKISLLSILCTLITLVSCHSTTNSNSVDKNFETNSNQILISYFSCTGNTEQIANLIANETKGTLFEIVPSDPYTEEDLQYYTDCRADKEQNDPTCRPQIANQIANVNQYNTLFIGHPIWHGKLPKIIYTFLETYDLANYTIIPFCTSGSTGITTSLNEIKDLEPQAIIKEGKRFSTNASQAEVSEWIDSLQLNIKGEEEMEKTLNIHVNQQTLQAQLENNSSVNALLEELKNKNITLSMNDYGNFEKVGSLGLTLPRNDKQITTKPGDIILYQGNQLTIYYDTNTWNFTKIGSIPNMTRESMLDFLGIGPIQVTLSIN